MFTHNHLTALSIYCISLNINSTYGYTPIFPSFCVSSIKLIKFK